MIAQPELNDSGQPTGAYWFAGHRIMNCPTHPERWLVCDRRDVKWCSCFKSVKHASHWIFRKARPATSDTIFAMQTLRPQHLRLVVSR